MGRDDSAASERETLVRDLERALVRSVAQLPDVAAAWLFGSHASGTSRSDSDVDVAILLGRVPAASERLALLRQIISVLADGVAADRIDLVLLDDAPVALAFQVLKHGRLLVSNDETALHRFRVRTYREHGDREIPERFFREVARARAARLAARG